MKKYLDMPTNAAALRIVRLIDRALGHPTRGVHVGRGPHVDLDDGSRTGWTLTECRIDSDTVVVLTDRAQSLDGQSVEDPDNPGGPRVRIDLRAAQETHPRPPARPVLSSTVEPANPPDATPRRPA